MIDFTPSHKVNAVGGDAGSFTGTFPDEYLGRQLVEHYEPFTINNSTQFGTDFITKLVNGSPVDPKHVSPNTQSIGMTSTDNPFLTYTAFGYDSQTTQYIQIFELGNALGLITGRHPAPGQWNTAPGQSNEPGRWLQDCVKGKTKTP